MIRPTLCGIDVLGLERVRRHRRTWENELPRRVLTADERAWAGTVELVAACVSAKESAVKAIGGRPPTFAWDDIVVDAPRSAPERLGCDGFEVGALCGLGDPWLLSTVHFAPELLRWLRLRWPVPASPQAGHRFESSVIWTRSNSLMTSLVIVTAESNERSCK
jgi:phosphopantetheinyl transferase (holo-ACP synthase)